MFSDALQTEYKSGKKTKQIRRQLASEKKTTSSPLPRQDSSPRPHQESSLNVISVCKTEFAANQQSLGTSGSVPITPQPRSPCGPSLPAASPLDFVIRPLTKPVLFKLSLPDRFEDQNGQEATRREVTFLDNPFALVSDTSVCSSMDHGFDDCIGSISVPETSGFIFADNYRPALFEVLDTPLPGPATASSHMTY